MRTVCEGWRGSSPQENATRSESLKPLKKIPRPPLLSKLRAGDTVGPGVSDRQLSRGWPHYQQLSECASPKEYSHPSKGSQDPDTHKENQRWTKGNRLQKGLSKRCGRKTLTGRHSCPWGGEPALKDLPLSLRERVLLWKSLQPGSCAGCLDQNCSQCQDDGGNRIPPGDSGCPVRRGPCMTEASPQTQMMESLIIPCWTSLGSWETRESECLLRVPCLQSSSVLCPMHSEEWCVKWKLTWD